MAVNRYRIADEPTPGPLAVVATSPLWPFVAMMLGGVWLSWTWFAVNSFAVGSPSRRQEITWILVGLVVSAFLAYAILASAERGIIANEHIKYAVLVVTVWQLGVSYVLFMLQNRTIEIYEYFGGVLRNGLIFLVLAAFIGRPLVATKLPAFLKLVLV